MIEDSAPGNLVAESSFEFDDVDLTDTHTASTTAAAGNTLGGTLSVSVTTGATGPGVGTVTWNYTLANSAAQHLAQGQVVIEEFTVTMSDGHGGTVDQLINVAVVGTNDTPVAVNDSNASDPVTEAGIGAIGGFVAQLPGDPSARGNVLANDTDVDSGDTKVVTAVNGSAAALGTAVVGVYGSLVLAADGSYTYTLNNADPDTDALPQGAVASDVFSYTMRDSMGALSTANLTINIGGWNDEPVAAADTNATDPVVEAGVGPGNTPFAGDASANGNVLVNDSDVDAGSFLSVARINGATELIGQPVVGTYGTLVLNANGNYTYTLNNADPDTNALVAGASVTDTFFYSVRDQFGTISTTTLTATINGTNDAVVINAAATTAAGLVVEDANTTPSTTDSLIASGTIAFDDVDLIDTHTASFVPAANATALGTFTLGTIAEAATTSQGSLGWNYALNNAAAQYLAQGQSVVEHFAVTVKDPAGANATQDVAVTINGTNDAVVINAAATSAAGLVVEDANTTPSTTDSLIASGTIAFDDVDLIDTHTASFVPAANATALGTFTLGTIAEAATTSQGSLGWSYALNNAAAQYLAQGQSVVEHLAVTVTDPSGANATQDVAVTITGTNDVPTLAAINPAYAVAGAGKVVIDILGYSDTRGLLAVQTVNGVTKYIVAGTSDTGLVFQNSAGAVLSNSSDFSLLRLNADGTIDTTFGGGDGKVTTDFSGRADSGNAVTVQANGMIIVAGTMFNPATNTTNFAIARYNVDGTLDTTFSPAGVAGEANSSFSIGVNRSSAGNAVAVQANGDIVVVGKVDTATFSDIALARYSSTGLPVNTFSGDGLLNTNVGGATATNDVGTAVAAQGNNFIVAGYTLNAGSNDFVLQRYTPAGVLDTTFGTAGQTLTGFTTTAGAARTDLATTMAIQADGKIVVAGESYNGSVYQLAIARYTAAGLLDTTFGDAAATGGRAGTVTSQVLTGDNGATAIAFQTDGSLLVAGYAFDGSINGRAMVVVRYTPSGVLDTSFGSNGILRTVFETSTIVGQPGSQEAASIVVDPLTGKFVVSGFTGDPSFRSSNQFALVRYNADGSLDTSFGAVPIIGDGPTIIEDSRAVLSATGSFGFDDVDLIDTHFVSSVVADAANRVGGTLTAVVSAPATGAGAGTVTWSYSAFDPRADFLAQGEVTTERFTITLNDGSGGSVNKTIGITIRGTNDTPIATPDGGAFVEGFMTDNSVPIVVSVLGNDHDPDTGGTIRVTAAAALTGGTAVIVDATAGTIRYTPNPNIIGPNTFSYTVTDQFGASATTSVEITVATVLGTPGNDAALNGDPNVDYIVALGGNDTINAAGGDDYVFAGLGNDVIIGGAGADQLEGGPISAGGLPDDDIFRVSGTELVGDVIDGGDGTNTLQFSGTGAVTWGPASMFRVQQLDMAGLAMNVTGNADLSLLTKIGTSGVINGSAAVNTITGTQQADTINGLGGNDVLSGAGGIDTLDGGAGADTINGDEGNDIITGGAEADVLIGGADNDTFLVGGGDLTGDSINGGAGSDTLQLQAAVTLGAAAFAIANVETLDMAGFNIVLQAATSLDLSTVETLTRPGTLGGSAGVDVINGTQGNDRIDGGGGDDIISGGLGADSLIGNAGADRINGGAGDDLIQISFGHLTGDIIDGGEGTDTWQIQGEINLGAAGVTLSNVETLDMTGFNILLQGALSLDLSGIQTLQRRGTLGGSGAAETITGTQGDDRIDGGGGDDIISGGLGADALVGNAGADRINGGAGNDLIQISFGHLTGDIIDGGEGTDTWQIQGDINLGAAGFAISNVEQLDMGGFALNVNTTAAVNLSALTKIGTSGAINGTAVANTITGTQSADTIDGGGGNDELSGAGGIDTLLGAAGADTINGDAGDDIITGGAEADVLNGGADNDTFLVSGGDLNGVNAAGVTGSGDSIDGGAGTDTLRFTANTNLTTGFTMANVEQLDMGTFALGVNTVVAVNLSSLTRLNTSPTATIDGNNLANTITGTQSADTITGGAGTDVLNGAGGADRIVGGAGNDTLTGGTGNDTFVFNVASNAGNADTITDFNAAVDLIELSLLQFTQLGGTNISGATLAAGDFAFGTAASTVGALVNVIYDSATGALYYDSNGGTNANRSLIATLNPLPTDTFDFNNIRVGP